MGGPGSPFSRDGGGSGGFRAFPGGAQGRRTGAGAPGHRFGGRFGGAVAGGLLTASSPSPAAVRLLERQASSYTWVAATVGANAAAGYQLATQDPVMAIGGFNGTDPAPTLAEFQRDVHKGEIHYFIAGGRFGGMGGPPSGRGAAFERFAAVRGGFGRGRGGFAGGRDAGTSGGITRWVRSHFRSTTVDGLTLYDLTQPLTTASSRGGGASA